MTPRVGAQIAGHRTTADWLATTTGITSPAAGWRGCTPPGRYVMTYLRRLPGVGRGQISLEHVRAIRGARRSG